ncbi:MAG: plasmid pRiA4b ORF-3 family protein [Pleomorphochaeta sp.]
MNQEKCYLLRIELLEVEPTIWREFAVPCDITLDRFHDVVQIVMGWMSSHLYQFVIKDKKYSEFEEYILDFDDVFDSKNVRLNQFMTRKNQKIIYEYDFGDGWQHEITLLNSNYNSHSAYDLVCVDGERACPPEDVGGAYGYQHFIECIENEDDDEHEDMLMWIDYDYDPDELEIDYINFELLKYLNYSRDRVLPWLEE